MKKNDRRFLILFVLLLTLSLLYLFQTSYAKYRKQVKGEMQARIASWNIKVNDEDISNKTQLTNTITPVFDVNEYVNDGVLAPGSTGHFDIVVNAEDVDVDFNYEITCVVDDSTPLLDLVFTRYTINDTNYNFTQTGKITGELTKNSTDTTFRVFFKWNDDATNQMNNQADTEYAIDEANEETKMKVSIKFTQKNA